ncbi:uncharacterized protein LOC143151664 [Ptiloglossa arizonensis]|uniref:uncharacterized protein LOC143151664 n=1 Tax=Ptiloglossa arizonensis TaxID=3350558 RepID=UPI003FA08F9E
MSQSIHQRSVSASRTTKDEKTRPERGLALDRRSGSVATLTGSGDELGPLANEYGDAFGALHGEPGLALARFKRIKRVLRPQASSDT